MAMPRESVTFRIGTTFPSDDSVARFLTVLAMMSNDLLRLVSWMLELDAPGRANEEGEQIFIFRLQPPLLQASTFIRQSISRWPQVRTFVAGLPTVAQEELARVQDATDPKADSYVGDWIEALD